MSNDKAWVIAILGGVVGALGVYAIALEHPHCNALWRWSKKE